MLWSLLVCGVDTLNERLQKSSQDTFFAHSDSIVGVFKDLTIRQSLLKGSRDEKEEVYKTLKLQFVSPKIGKSSEIKMGFQYRSRVVYSEFQRFPLYKRQKCPAPGSISSNIRDSKPSSWTAGLGDHRNFQSEVSVERIFNGTEIGLKLEGDTTFYV